MIKVQPESTNVRQIEEAPRGEESATVWDAGSTTWDGDTTFWDGNFDTDYLQLKAVTTAFVKAPEAVTAHKKLAPASNSWRGIKAGSPAFSGIKEATTQWGAVKAKADSFSQIKGEVTPWGVSGTSISKISIITRGLGSNLLITQGYGIDVSRVAGWNKVQEESDSWLQIKKEI